MLGLALSRRSFLAGAGAALAVAAADAAPAPSRAARRIDTHFHIWAPHYLAEPEVQRAIAALGLGDRPAGYYDWTVARALAAMDQDGVATAITSCSIPGIDLRDVALGRRLARDWNDYAARLKQDHPGRFGAFATLPMNDVEGSLAEIGYSLDTLHAEGFGLLTRYGDKFVSDAAFAPILAELDRRGAVVYLHPAWAGSHGASPTGTLGGPFAAFVETPTDTTRCIVTMLFAGTFRRYPRIRWIFSHGGGTIMPIAGRIEQLMRARGTLERAFPDGIFAELARHHYDVANATAPAGMAALLAAVPANRLLFGSDYPYLPIATTARGLAALGLPRADLTRIERGNALALFPGLGGRA